MLKTANNYRSVFDRCANAVSESNYGAYKIKTGGRPREYDDADVCLNCDPVDTEQNEEDRKERMKNAEIPL